jgi:hypothetical protein
VFKGIVDLKIRNRRGACFRDSNIFCSEHPCVYTGESGDLSNFVVEKTTRRQRRHFLQDQSWWGYVSWTRTNCRLSHNQIIFLLTFINTYTLLEEAIILTLEYGIECGQ